MTELYEKLGFDSNPFKTFSAEDEKKVLNKFYIKPIKYNSIKGSSISVDDATNLFEIIEIRFQLSSTIITSQLPVKDWYGYLQNNTVADAILDRVVHSST